MTGACGAPTYLAQSEGDAAMSLVEYEQEGAAAALHG